MSSGRTAGVAAEAAGPTFANPKAAFSNVLAYTAVRLSELAALASGSTNAMTRAFLERSLMDWLMACTG
jgi:hypothetical protein